MIELADPALFARLEAFYDAVPRHRARAEPHEPFVLFIPSRCSFPFYARPALGAESTATVDDIAAVQARQRELGLPEAFEWVHETTPGLLSVAEAAGLTVVHAPLMVLEPALLPAPSSLTDVPVRLLDPDSPTFAADLATFRAVATVGFSAPGNVTGAVSGSEAPCPAKSRSRRLERFAGSGAPPGKARRGEGARAPSLRTRDAGPTERDAALQPVDDLEVTLELVRSSLADYALAESGPAGALASGTYQRAGDVTEIAGVSTLPVARRRGLGAAVTAALARRALDTGTKLVFLSAGTEQSARIYARIGFRRIGTACIAHRPPPTS